MCINHYENIKSSQQCCGAIILFTIGIIYLLFSVCGIIGTLIFITGEIYSNGNLFIKTACIESDISCHGLFKFSSSFPLDTKTHGIIFYYIYLKKYLKTTRQKIWQVHFQYF